MINDSWRDKLIHWIRLLGAAGKAAEYPPVNRANRMPWQRLVEDGIYRAI